MPHDVENLVWLLGCGLLVTLGAVLKMMISKAYANLESKINGQGKSLDDLKSDCARKDKQQTKNLNDAVFMFKDELNEAREGMNNYATTKQIEVVNVRIDKLTKEIANCATHDDIHRIEKTYENNFRKLFSDIGELKGMLSVIFQGDKSQQ